MASTGKTKIFVGYWVLVMGGIIALVLNFHLLDMFCKSLLMPLLMAAVVLNTSPSPIRVSILIALLFSWLGDVMLMLEAKSSIFFLAGIICFLVTHLLYIRYFVKIKKPGLSIAKRYPFIIILIGLYTGTLLIMLLPTLGSLRFPVSMYALIISIMLYFSFALPYSVNKQVRQLFIIGALFFVVSDSVLAIDKFYRHLPYAGIFIRLFYCIGQYGIVAAFIKKRN